MRRMWFFIGLVCACDRSKVGDSARSDGAPDDSGSTPVDSDDTGSEISCEDPRLELVSTWSGDSLYGPTVDDWPFGLGSCGWGLAALDLDEDGDEDLLVAGVAAPTWPLINVDGDLSPGDGVQFDGGLLPAGNGLSVGDFNGDGRPDVVLLRSTGAADLVYTNLGGGQFSSIELEVSTEESQHAAAFDADGDGDLDLFVSRHIDLLSTDLEALEEGTLRGDGNRLYLNDGGVFVPAPQDDTADAASFQAVPLDADNDGDLDLYVVNDFGPMIKPNVLLKNDGTGSFSPDPSCGCELAMFGMGATAGDYNNDGHVDLHISDLGSPRLLMGLGDGSFADSTVAAGAYIEPSADRVTSWATLFVDLDQDGWDDLITAFGPVLMGIEGDWTDVVDHPYVNDLDDSSEQINAALRNVEGTFVEDSAAVGFDLRGSSRAIVVSDFDADGMPDVVVSGVQPDLTQTVRLYRGRAGCGPGITVGFPERSAADVGTQLEWSVNGETRVRWYQPGTSYSASGSMLHLGLGGHSEADWVRVTPLGGTMVESLNVPAGARLDQRSYQ